MIKEDLIKERVKTLKERIEDCCQKFKEEIKALEGTSLDDLFFISCNSKEDNFLPVRIGSVVSLEGKAYAINNFVCSKTFEVKDGDKIKVVSHSDVEDVLKF